MTAPPPRLTKLLPSTLDRDQRELYEAIAGGPRAGGPFPLTDGDGGLEGPFNAMLLAPALGAALQALGGAIRYGGTLPDRVREIAILVVAGQWHSDFELYAHTAVGHAIGLTEAELAALSTPGPIDLDDPYEQLVADTARALAARSDLSDGEYAAARAGLGLPALFELLTLVGYYATLALQLRVFRVPRPDTTLPDPTSPTPAGMTEA